MYLCRQRGLCKARPTAYAESWARDSLLISDVRILNNLSDISDEEKCGILFTYEWVLDFIRKYGLISTIVRGIIISKMLKSHGMVVWVILPDTCYLPVNYFAQSVLTKANGSMIIIQSTKNESEIY